MVAAKITAAMESALLALINGYRPRLHVSTRDALTRRGLFDGETVTETGRKIAEELRAAARAECQAEMARCIAEGTVHAAWAAACQDSPSWTHVPSSGCSDLHSTIIERATCRGGAADIARAVRDASIPATSPPAPASSAGERAVVHAQRHAPAAEIDAALAVGKRAPEPEWRCEALIGDLSIVLPDGTALHASTDLALAEQWASATVTSKHGSGGWEALTAGQRYGHIADALSELRGSHAAAVSARAPRPILRQPSK